ncbi:MAG TPA: hypothetical protein VJH22_04200 [Candidatus Nanoarchaeia archaeon]|nr:hypothetical protein [Candidatus Nanoarchaeia archaeon]
MNLIDTFNSVRDLPYHCPESKDDHDHRCWGKHRILFKKLKELGCHVRYRVCEFSWDDLRLPKEIVKLSPKKLDYHLYVEVQLDGKWIALDCSDDSGLPSYTNWDGKSDTELAVKCRRVLSPEESATIEEFDRKNYASIIAEYHDLYTAINKFLNKIRK